MPASVQAGLVLALGTAFVSILGFLLKQRGAAQTPPISLRTPLRSTAALFANRWWLLGLAVATGSWFLHVGALALAPITLVQTVIAGGLVLLTVIAERLFGFRVTRREWIGVALTAAGLAFLAATLGDSADGRHSDYASGTLALYVGGVTAVSLAAMAAVPRVRAHAGTLLAAAAGLQWGASDVTIKALSGHLGADGLFVVFTPMAAVIAALSLLGLLVSARSLQIGEAIAVIATTSAAANLSTIAAGLVVFGEPLPGGTPAVVARLGAFALVVGAAVLTPAPARLAAPAAVANP
jgi:drug/metabolite transporter (DMT)-like permease